MSLASLKQLWRVIQASEVHSGMESQKVDIRGHFPLSVPSLRWSQELHISYGVLPSLPISGSILLKAQPAYLLFPCRKQFFLPSKELSYSSPGCYMSFWETWFFAFASAHSSLTKTHHSHVSRGSAMFVELLTFTQAGLPAIGRQGEYQDTHIRTMNHYLEQKS